MCPQICVSMFIMILFAATMEQYAAIKNVIKSEAIENLKNVKIVM